MCLSPAVLLLLLLLLVPATTNVDVNAHAAACFPVTTNAIVPAVAADVPTTNIAVLMSLFLPWFLSLPIFFFVVLVADIFPSSVPYNSITATSAFTVILLFFQMLLLLLFFLRLALRMFSLLSTTLIIFFFLA